MTRNSNGLRFLVVFKQSHACGGGRRFERVKHVRDVLSEPDLREMPKVGWRSELKRKADGIDFSNVDYKGAVSNATKRLPKLPWRRKAVEDQGVEALNKK